MRRASIVRRIFVAVLLLVLIDTAGWAILCRRIERAVRDAATEAPQQGWSIAAESLHWSGWPFAAAIDLGDVAIAGTMPPGLVWQVGAARVELALFHPTVVAIRLGGAQALELQGVPPIPLTAATADIVITLTGSAPPHARIAGLTVRLADGALTLDAAELGFPPNGIIADLAGLSLPGVATPISAIRVQATTDPALPVAADPEASARAWREAGGHVDITQASLHWDTLEAAGSGRITLDQHLQPAADGTVQASGLPQMLADLAKAGTLAPAQASAATAVLTVLAAPSGGARVDLPISFSDGVLRLARFPLLRLPPLAWDRSPG